MTPTAILTAAIAAGDQAALASLYRQRFDELYAHARRTSGRDEHFCLDVVQDAMVRVIESIKPMHDEEHLRRWLGAVVHSCCLDRLRAEARRLRRERVRAQQPAHDSELDDRIKWLAQALGEVEPGVARLLRLRFRLGWTLGRIGAALGLKSGAVDGRLNRSLARLRAKAREQFHD